MLDTPYATVHVGIVPLDPEDFPPAEVLDHLIGMNTRTGLPVILDGDSFTEWGEPAEDNEPLHAVVILERPHNEDGEPTDYLHNKRPARQEYADRARDAVLDLLPEGRYRLADYVAVDLAPVWGEDTEVIGLWA